MAPKRQNNVTQFFKLAKADLEVALMGKNVKKIIQLVKPKLVLFKGN